MEQSPVNPPSSPAAAQDQLLWTSLGGNNSDKIGGNGHVYQYRQTQADGSVKTTTVLVDLGSLFSNRSDTGYDSLLADGRRYLQKFVAATSILPPEYQLTKAEWAEALKAKAARDFENPAYKKLKAGDAERARLERLGGPTIADATHKTEAVAEALFVTHGHMDHIGAIPHYIHMGFRLPPIYCTPLTREMIKSTLSSARVPMEHWPQFRTINPGDSVTVGPMRFEAVAMSHSISQGVAFAIHSPAARIIHSGDAKADQSVRIGPPTDFNRLKAIAALPGGVDALLIDSTKADCPGETVPERQVEDSLIGLIGQQQGKRVIVSIMGTSLERTVALAVAAALSQRTLVIEGAAIEAGLVAMKNSGIELERLVERAIAERGLNPADFPLKKVGGKAQEAANLPPGQALVLATGTQGEPLAAMYKMAVGSHQRVSLNPQRDVVIFSASVIPGNETQFGKMKQMLDDKGMTVITAKDALVHASGHGAQEDLKRIAQASGTRLVLPMHGDPRQLDAQKKLAESIGIAAMTVPNGAAISFAKGRPPQLAGVVRESWIGLRDETPEGEWRFRTYSYGEHPGGKPIFVPRKQQTAPQQRQGGGPRQRLAPRGPA